MPNTTNEITISCARAKALIKKYPTVYGTTLSSADRDAIESNTASLLLVSYDDGTRDIIVAKAAPKKTKKIEEIPVVEEEVNVEETPVINTDDPIDEL